MNYNSLYSYITKKSKYPVMSNALENDIEMRLPNPEIVH